MTVQAAYAKNGQTRSVSLNSVVLAALNRLPKLSEFVFAKPSGKPYHAIRGFRGACQRAGLIGVTLQSTRHTFATHWSKTVWICGPSRSWGAGRASH